MYNNHINLNVYFFPESPGYAFETSGRSDGFIKQISKLVFDAMGINLTG